MATVTFKGTEVNTYGDLPQAGSIAPDFELVASNLADCHLADFPGVRLINIVPSLDTPVCASSTREFHRLASSIENAKVLVVSMDLPFAQGRFCTTEGLPDVAALSMLRTRKFAKDYGVLLTDGPLRGLCARAVVVIDSSGKVVYSELVPEITQEPNYEAAIAAVKAAS